ncbi:MAG: helix-turn-helix transcriptional regulator [Oscillospiraceae bacterium]
MSMNTIVREKRKELGLTQEQVAACLGVSAPAVNKWEKGSTYPDVALLPALARLLKTDLNTLLCFNEEMTQKEIGLFLNRVADICFNEGFPSAFAAAMEKVREYPASAELLYSLAMILEGSLMTSELPPEEMSAYGSEITALYKRVVECGASKYSDAASYMLASKAISDGDCDKAREALDMLPEYSGLDKRTLQASLLLKEGKNGEAAKLLEHKLLGSINEAQSTLVALARIAVLEGDEENARRLAHCGREQAELFCLWEYTAFLVPLEVAVSQKNAEAAVSALKSMLAALMIPWDMKKSPICRHITEKAGEKNFGSQFLPSLLSELKNSPEYDFLQDFPEFLDLLEQYGSKCRESKPM